MALSDLEKLCRRHNIRIDSELVDSSPLMGDSMPIGSTHWKVRLTRTVLARQRQLTTFFSQGPAYHSEPNVADVLHALISDARAGEETFEDFCADFGYDTDSRRAEQTWKTCSRMTPKIKRFLGDELEDFQQAEH